MTTGVNYETDTDINMRVVPSATWGTIYADFVCILPEYGSENELNAAYAKHRCGK